MSKQIVVCIAALYLLSGCYSVKKKVAAAEPYVSQINWPDNYQPSEAKFYVHNQIDIAAPAEYVWAQLMDAEGWPAWYEGATEVKVSDRTDGQLHENAEFTWKTMGIDFRSTIEEFQPPYRLSWESHKKSIMGYHSWLIIPTEDGCRLLTDESQHGWLTFMQKTFIPRKLEQQHDLRLAAIKDRAEANYVKKIQSE